MKTKVERHREIVRSKVLLRMLSARVGTTSIYGFASRFDDLSALGSCTRESKKWQRVFSGKQPLTKRAINELAAVFPDAAEFYHRGPFDLWGAVWGDLSELGAIANGGVRIYTLGILLAEFEAEILLAEAYQEPLTLLHLVKSIALHRLSQGMNTISLLEVDLRGTYRCVSRCINDENVMRELAALGVLDDVRNELDVVSSDALAKTSSAMRWDALAERLDWVT